MTRTGIAALALAIAGAASLAFAPTVPDQGTMIRLEHDPDQRADCLLDLLRDEGHYNTLPSWDYMNAVLNYTDRHYGGPCAAARHLAQHGYY